MAHPSERSVVVAASVVGIGLSGFFDGILLHQVLQWHHLLSLVPGAAFRDVGTQILADGLFHVLMYVVTGAGLWMLWRCRGILREGAGGWRPVAGGGLLGFGLWNVVDVGLFHWILGIHRIRVNVPDPLIYDVSWLVLLGLAPLLAGWRILRGPRGTRGGQGTATGLALLVLLAAPLAARPAPGSNSAIVFAAPGKLPALLTQAARAGTPILWIDPSGRMIALSLDEGGGEAALYRSGALLVTRSPALAGCAASLQV